MNLSRRPTPKAPEGGAVLGQRRRGKVLHQGEAPGPRSLLHLQQQQQQQQPEMGRTVLVRGAASRGGRQDKQREALEDDGDGGLRQGRSVCWG